MSCNKFIAAYIGGDCVLGDTLTPAPPPRFIPHRAYIVLRRVRDAWAPHGTVVFLVVGRGLGGGTAQTHRPQRLAKENYLENVGVHAAGWQRRGVRRRCGLDVVLSGTQDKLHLG